MTLLIPAAFFAALDKGAVISATSEAGALVSDATRGQFLQMSRGLAIILIAVSVVASFLHPIFIMLTRGFQLHMLKDLPPKTAWPQPSRAWRAQAHNGGAEECIEPRQRGA